MKNLKLYIDTKLRANRCSDNTIKAYESNIREMLSFIDKDEKEITYLDLLQWKTKISSQSSATINRKIVAIKGYFEFLKDIDYIKDSPAKKIDNVKIENKIKVPLTVDEINAMLKATSNKRDKAIIDLLVSTGLRISELTNLTLDNIHSNSIIINGKGNKERVIFINEKTKKSIEDYLQDRGNADLQNVFLSTQKTKLNPNSFDRTLKKIGKKAKIKDYERISCHLFRATSASLMSQNGVPIQVIKEVLGHSNIQTTMIYVKNTEQQIKDAMNIQLF